MGTKVVFVGFCTFLHLLVYFCDVFRVVSADETGNGGYSQNETEIWKKIIENVNSTKIRENLKFLSQHPHMAGTVHDERLIEWIEETWNNQGLDSVQRATYRSLLSFPSLEKPNKVELLDEDGGVIFVTSNTETPLRPEDVHPDMVPAFNAFSPSGTVQGKVVYVNYGTHSDYESLQRLAVNVSGKIVIAKYGNIYRGNKVNLAEENGAIGVILFSDPLEYAQGPIYPDDIWLSGSGMQRGSIMLTKGDSLTPQYPSIDGAYRIPMDLVEFPGIPCQPIGYEDAANILNLTMGQPVPSNWEAEHLSRERGNRSDVDGSPWVCREESCMTVRLTVNNYLQETNVTNVIGIIRGSSEPDRYVLAGNHRDAWGFGAIDASGGTAQMVEVTRVFGQLLQEGWRPKRTIVFCSWGGEEMGLIGSTEWVEENYVKLTRRAIAYINTDVCAFGDRFSPAANPFLHHFLNDVTKQVPAPLNHSRSLHDDWAAAIGRSTDQNEQPIEVALPGGGTDHVPFAFFAGIPSVDLTFALNSNNLEVPISMYPAYHSGYDTFHLVDALVDPGFHRHRACSQLNGLLLQKLSDADLLPFNLTHYAKVLHDAMTNLKSKAFYIQLIDRGIKIDKLDSMINKFGEASEQWQQRVVRLRNETQNNPLLQRALNDQLARLEQAFLLPQGLPFQKSYRHAMFSLSSNDFYGSNAFPGLHDLIARGNSWRAIEQHVSELIVCLNAAIAVIHELHFL